MEDTGTTRFRDLTLDGFVARLASAQPTPGGGSASAVAASLAAGLVAMVASLSEGRPKYEAHTLLIARSKAAGESLVDRCLLLADEDAAAYAGFSAALKLPKESDAEREARAAAIRAAARAAALAPLGAVEACLEIVAAAEGLAGRSNVNASSDLVVAALLAEAGARGAAANVMVNLPMTGDETLSGELSIRVDDLLGEIERLAVATREVVLTGAARPPLPDPA